MCFAPGVSPIPSPRKRGWWERKGGPVLASCVTPFPKQHPHPQSGPPLCLQARAPRSLGRLCPCLMPPACVTAAGRWPGLPRPPALPVGIRATRRCDRSPQSSWCRGSPSPSPRGLALAARSWGGGSFHSVWGLLWKPRGHTLPGRPLPVPSGLSGALCLTPHSGPPGGQGAELESVPRGAASRAGPDTPGTK